MQLVYCPTCRGMVLATAERTESASGQVITVRCILGHFVRQERRSL